MKSLKVIAQILVMKVKGNTLWFSLLGPLGHLIPLLRIGISYSEHVDHYLEVNEAAPDITPCQLCKSIPIRTGYNSGNNCGFACFSRCSTKIL